MAFTWSVSVIGLSTLTVSGTALPFSDRGGNSSLTLPVLTRAEPTTARMASCIATAVACAGSTAMIAVRPRPAAAPPAIHRNSRREACRSISVSQCRQEYHHVLDLLRAQDGLAAPGRRDPHQSLGS